jgi:methylmalonyl-CoA/ethylmalonyl-CoA epimerase
VTAAVLDHVAIGTRDLTDGWQLFGGLLGGTWAYGGNSPGYWWGQVSFSAGPKIELLAPSARGDSGGRPPGSAQRGDSGGRPPGSTQDTSFLERFLTARGPGPHHYNFLVPDIEQTLAGVAALGIEPVGVRLGNPRWKEAFLHPRDAYGIVIQVAEQNGPPPVVAPPAELPPPGPATAFALAEQHVHDLAGAVRLFRDVLAGAVSSADGAGQPDAAELTWPNGARLRLVQTAGRDAGSTPTSGAVSRLVFSRDGAGFSEAELRRSAELARRLGVSLQLRPA